MEQQNGNACSLNHTTIEMKNIPVEEKKEKRRPVLRQALYPILFVMKLFGLFYNDADSFFERIGMHGKWKEKIFKYYAFFMNCVIFALFLKSISGKDYVFFVCLFCFFLVV